MYEEIQQKRKPKAPKNLYSTGFHRLLGIISPAKFQMRKMATDQTEAEKRFFIELQKYRLYKRMVTQDEWRYIYRKYRLDRRTV